MASVRDTYHHLLTTLPPLPFLKSTKPHEGGYCCSLQQLACLAALLLAFAAGAAAGHLYWRRVRVWARRTHIGARRWTAARRDEAATLWDGVVGRVAGAVAGWKNGMGGGDTAQGAGGGLRPEEGVPAWLRRNGGGGGGRKRKGRGFWPGEGGY